MGSCRTATHGLIRTYGGRRPGDGAICRPSCVQTGHDDGGAESEDAATPRPAGHEYPRARKVSDLLDLSPLADDDLELVPFTEAPASIEGHDAGPVAGHCAPLGWPALDVTVAGDDHEAIAGDGRNPVGILRPWGYPARCSRKAVGARSPGITRVGDIGPHLNEHLGHPQQVGIDVEPDGQSGRPGLCNLGKGPVLVAKRRNHRAERQVEVDRHPLDRISSSHELGDRLGGYAVDRGGTEPHLGVDDHG